MSARQQKPPLLLLHGLTYDRRQWGPVISELAVIDPGRHVLAVDLPGHGESPPRDSYDLGEVAAYVHEAVTEAGMEPPTAVGHSLGAIVATIYAATYPAHGVVNVDQPLQAGNFGEVLRRQEPVLRSSSFLKVWDSMLARMRIDLLPPAAAELVRTATTPRQDLLLGYWNEIMVTEADELTDRRARELATIRSKGASYRLISSGDLDPQYRRWLELQLPEIAITVVAGSHFPHLADPAGFARMLVS